MQLLDLPHFNLNFLHKITHCVVFSTIYLTTMTQWWCGSEIMPTVKVSITCNSCLSVEEPPDFTSCDVHTGISAEEILVLQT